MFDSLNYTMADTYFLQHTSLKKFNIFFKITLDLDISRIVLTVIFTIINWFKWEIASYTPYKPHFGLTFGVCHILARSLFQPKKKIKEKKYRFHFIFRELL